jgi:hypothetical protein
MAMKKALSRFGFPVLATAGAVGGAYYLGNKPLVPVKFSTWRNTTDPKQAEHMTVKYGRGSSGHYEDFRMGSGPPRTDLPKFGAVNKLTGIDESKPYSNLAYGSHTPTEHRDRFLARPALKSDVDKGRDYRYDSKEAMRAKVSVYELWKLKQMTSERQQHGVFHLYGEASDPYTTRCMTHIETLASVRGQKLSPDNPSKVAHEFHELNPSSTEKPKLKTYSVEGVQRPGNVPVGTPVKNHPGTLDKAYWEAANKGAHNVGRPLPTPKL